MISVRVNLPAEILCFHWTKIGKRRERKEERTKVDEIALEVLDELVLFERHDAYVASVAAGVDVIGDLGCPVEPGDDTIEGIAPGGLEELEEVTEDANVRLRLLQVLLLIL